jgi:hypothetical protein
MSEPARIDETAALSEVEIPEELWGELETLVPTPETWL